ncbi:MAG: hypothetical protein IT243_00440 [Bacteroidia bacterium]|nr:hypothetical protein [Bacteroidia bacterium]
MGCGTCSTTKKGCGNSNIYGTVGCNKLNTYDWLSDIEMPDNFTPFDIVEIRFKGSRKEFYRNTNKIELCSGDAVVTESEMGHDIGHVSLTGELVKLQLKKARITEDSPQIKKIYRIASEGDIVKYNEYKEKEAATLEKARTIALEQKLEMKLSDIEFQGDGKKVIFFYTAEDRVDFRELIKRYATEFKTRIEMRQISYREEASRLGGIGSCGRELCCSTWFTDFKVVNISAAKHQNLSINMLKLSGQCGRLKCCLNYELDTYLEAINDFPSIEKIILKTKIGTASLQKVDILKKMTWFSYSDNQGEWIPVKLNKVKEVLEKNKNGIFPETLVERPMGAEVQSKTAYKVDDMLEDSKIDRLENKNRQKQKNRNTNNSQPNNNNQRNKRHNNKNRNRRDKNRN